MKTQVLSVKQATQLIKLGVDMSNATCYWRCAYPLKNDITLIVNKSEFEQYKKLDMISGPDFKYTPTLTLQEIIAMLPESIDGHDLYMTKRKVFYASLRELYDSAEFEYYLVADSCYNLIDNAYNMLVLLLKNKNFQ